MNSPPNGWGDDGMVDEESPGAVVGGWPDVGGSRVGAFCSGAGDLEVVRRFLGESSVSERSLMDD